MPKDEIIVGLDVGSNKIRTVIGKIKGPEGKWTTGQQIKHLVQSLDQLNLAMKIPKFMLKSRFGTSNRSTREYSKVVERYKERLASNPNVVAPAARGMDIPPIDSMAELISKLRKGRDQIVKLPWRHFIYKAQHVAAEDFIQIVAGETEGFDFT